MPHSTNSIKVLCRSALPFLTNQIYLNMLKRSLTGTSNRSVSLRQNIYIYKKKIIQESRGTFIQTETGSRETVGSSSLSLLYGWVLTSQRWVFSLPFLSLPFLARKGCRLENNRNEQFKKNNNEPFIFSG